MILITGAGGKTGRALIPSLAKVESVCAFVHRQEQAVAVKSLGAEKVVVGDLRDGAAIRLAMERVRAVYHLPPNMNPDEILIAELVITEARRAGVEQCVYHSVLHPQTETMPHHWHKMRVEEMIFESGLPFTIMQPAPYMQNLLAAWKSIVEAGLLRVPYSVNARFSFLDLEDVAEAARTVLTEPTHKHATYELAGTLPTSHVEVAKIFGQVLRRDVKAEKEEIRDWSFRAERNGMSQHVIENLAKMFEYYDRWGLPGNPNVLTWLLKRKPTSIESLVQRIVHERDAIP